MNQVARAFAAAGPRLTFIRCRPDAASRPASSPFTVPPPCSYMSMPWVGLGLYSLTVPVIGATVLLGQRLLRLPTADVEQPLLDDAPHADTQPVGHHTDI